MVKKMIPSPPQSAKARPTLSVIVVTKNEADRIERCLGSVHGWAEEIVVIDSGSTDDTVEIAKRFTNNVYVTDWPGDGPQKQRALEKATAEWVLCIDADEAVSAALKAEIDRRLAGNPPESGFFIPWAVFVFGRRLDHGRSGRANLRLFRRRDARFTDSVVHGRVIAASNRVGALQNRLAHYTYRDMHHALQKFADYAWEWACQRHAEGNRAGLAAALFHAGWMFFSIYLLRRGFLDGRRGLLMAILFWQYTFNKYAALWSLDHSD